jgi:hypothetical protein
VPDATLTVQPQRFCLHCRHSLRGISSRHCPECGRAFDPNNPRTTLPHPHGSFWIDLAPVARFATIAIGVITAIALVASAIGYYPMFDPLLLVVMCVIPIGPVLLALPLALAAIGRVPLTRRWRLWGIALPLVCLSIWWTHWPLRLTLALHKPALSKIADQALVLGPSRAPMRVGLYRIRQVRVIQSNSNVGFQLAGDDGGGTYLVRCANTSNPQSAGASPRVWYNTNWKINLGRGWWLVDED